VSTDAPPPVDLDDALAVVGYGTDALDEALDARLADALDHASAAALVARLDELRRALQADRPHALRRGSGLVARLTGRDVEAEAEAERLRGRLGVLLAEADRSATELKARTVLQQGLLEETREAIARIAAAIDTARAWLQAHPDAGTVAPEMAAAAPRERLERRLDQLATVQAAWSIGARQIALLRDQNLDLLARHQRIRDVLLPAWRQVALAEAARSGGARAAQAADAYAAIESEVAAMAVTLDPRHAPHPARE